MQKKDFIEIEFTGRVKDGEVFDSNIKEELERLNSKGEAKPLIICLGEGIFLKGVEDFLIGKRLGEYNVELSPENAFGLRDTKLVQVVPSRLFTSQNLNPIPGALFNMDGRMAKVLSFSGGRVIVDFNHPLAGKYVEYTIKVLRKIDDAEEKIKAVMNILFRNEMKYSVEGDKVIISADKKMTPFVSAFKGKFKDMLGFNLEINEIQENETAFSNQENAISEAKP